jgi:UDP-N-acetylmuramoyl-L-alanyl-D-glutamate--2,6-diaminopimelate ligase
MNLKTLLASLQDAKLYGSADLEITGIACNSRQIRKGFLFAALPGLHTHGSQFLPQAEAAGAAAVLSDRVLHTGLPLIVASHPRPALAALSCVFFQHPSTQMRLFGVTGTNGKTTSTFLLRSVLEAAGMKTGLVGTVFYGSRGFNAPATLTTPESCELQDLLSQMVQDGCGACAMEVSSHSLDQSRADGCFYEAAIFTNLTQDHLDYHKTMEHYFQSKMKLFENKICNVKTASINLDDPYGQRVLASRVMLRQSSVSYGFGEGADYRLVKWVSDSQGSTLSIRREGRDTEVRTPLMARYNAYNVCGVYAALNESGIDSAAILAGIAQMKQVPGRLERIDHGQPFLILIDYAHTEDALRQLLSTVRPYTEKQLTVLFGCGGERDRGKRPLMGRAAGELADEIILTSDNPRCEDPEQILKEIIPGVEQSGNKNLHVFIDREEAIRYAVQTARPGDALVLAGKGHENYQVIQDEKLHFDEREILQGLLG